MTMAPAGRENGPNHRRKRYMINRDRVRTMTRLAIYEEGQGVADDKMNGYFKNDYIVSHMVGSFVSGTIAFLLIVLLYCCYYYDTLMIRVFENRIGGLVTTAVTLYAAFMIIFEAVTFFVYRWRYNATRTRLDRYRRRLTHLKESYDKEDRQGR